MASSRKIVIEFLGKDTSLSRTARQAGDETDKLGRRLKTVGKVGALALAAGALAMGKGLVSATKAAAQDQQQQALLAKQLKNSAGATKGQIAATEKWITAQGRSLGVTDDKLRPSLASLVRATGDVGKAQSLASLAMDVSAGSGKDLEAVSLGLAKAANGNVGALGRLGIATKNADGSTKSFAQIQEDLAKQFGGAAKVKAETYEGQMNRLKVIFGELKEDIGLKLIPVLTQLATWFLNKGLPALTKFGGYLKDTFGPVIEKVRAIVGGMFGGSTGGQVSAALDNIKSIINSAVSIIRSLWKLFGEDIVAFAKAAWSNMKTVIGGALNVIAGIFKVVSSLLKGDWKGVWDGIKQIVKGAWQIIKGIVKQGWNIVKTLFKAAGSVIKAIFGGIWNAVKSIAKKGIGQLVDAVKSIPGKLKALGSKMQAAGKFIIQKIFDGLKKAGGFVGGVAQAVWRAIKNVINGLIGRLNRAIPDKIGRPPLVIDLPNNPIPRLAKGGVVKARPGGTLAVLGEGGADEAVIPLAGRYAPRQASAAKAGDTYIFNISGVVGNKDELATAINQLLLRKKRLTGTNLGLT